MNPEGSVVVRSSPVVTLTSTVPAACGGVDTSSRVFVSLRTVTVVSPNDTREGHGAKQAKPGGRLRPVPVMLTSVPPVEGPAGGLTEAMTGRSGDRGASPPDDTQQNRHPEGDF